MEYRIYNTEFTNVVNSIPDMEFEDSELQYFLKVNDIHIKPLSWLNKIENGDLQKTFDGFKYACVKNGKMAIVTDLPKNYPTLMMISLLKEDNVDDRSTSNGSCRFIGILLFLLISLSLNAQHLYLYNQGFEYWHQMGSSSKTGEPEGWPKTYDSGNYDGCVWRTSGDGYCTEGSYSLGTNGIGSFQIKSLKYRLSEGAYSLSADIKWGYYECNYGIRIRNGENRIIAETSQSENAPGGAWVSPTPNVVFELSQPEDIYIEFSGSHITIDNIQLKSETGRIISSEYDVYIDELPDCVFYLHSEYHTAELVRCKNTEKEGEVIIPSHFTYEGKTYTVDQICESAFEHCTNISSVFIKGTTNIGRNAFAGCSSLEKVIYENPAIYTKISDGAFSDCFNLKSIFIFGSEAPQKGENVFPSNNSLIIYVPNLDGYKNWNDVNIKGMIYQPQPFTYSGQIPIIEPAFAPGCTATFDASTISKDAGTYNFWTKITHESGITSSGWFTFTIDKKDLNITANNTSREYGENNPTFTVTYEGFVEGEDIQNLDSIPTLTTSAMKTSNVGKYQIIVANAKSNNYEINYKHGTLDITKAPLSVKVEDTSREYGDANPSYTFSYYYCCPVKLFE